MTRTLRARLTGVYALSTAHITGVHITYEQLLAKIAPDVTGATSIVGKFRLPPRS